MRPSAFLPDRVILLAERVHVMRDTAADPLSAFRAVYVEATLRVSEAAARKKVRRFVYLSSIKAAGESSNGKPLREGKTSHPGTPMASQSGKRRWPFWISASELEIVILRAPLAYGPGVGANFLSLMRAVWPGTGYCLWGSLPRSLVAIDSLTSAIIVCASHPAAAWEILHVCDDEGPSVAELVR